MQARDKVRKSIYISKKLAGEIEVYAEENGFSESMIYGLAAKRLVENGMVLEIIKSMQNNGKCFKV